MSEEEKKAINELEHWRNWMIEEKSRVNKADLIIGYLSTCLNLIKKQDNKINKTMEKAKQFKFDLKAYNEVRRNNYVPVGAIGIRINELLKILEE